MTTRDHDQMDDAEFDAFLQGRGKLAGQLQALQQPTPSAALDAAILASAEAALAQHAMPAAANDAVLPGKAHYLSRLRMPLAMAASVIVSVLVVLQWRAHPENETPMQLAQAPVSTQAPAARQSENLQREKTDGNAGVVAEAPRQDVRLLAQSSMAKAKQADSVAESGAQLMQERTATRTAAIAAEAEAASEAKGAGAPPMHMAQADTAQSNNESARMRAAPAPASAPTSAPPASMPFEVGGLSKKLARTESASAPAAFSSHAKSPEKAKAWLVLIDEMITADLRKDALEEWAKFEKAYPEYPAPEKLKEKIRLLKQ